MNISGYVEIVRDSRQRTAGVFPLPDVAACVDYAITEAAEAIDARLRARRNGDKRNNGKDMDERAEWGQCGYMIGSALMQRTDWYDYGAGENQLKVSLYLTLSWLANFAVSCDNDEEDSMAALTLAMSYWHTFCEYRQWQPAELLRETCATFEAKHLASKKPFAYPVLSAEEAQRQGEAAT